MAIKLLTHRREWKDVLIGLILKVVRRIDQGLLEGCAPIFGREPAHMRATLLNLCHRLSDLFSRATVAHRLHLDEVGTTERLARERDEHAGWLKDLLVRVRGLVSAAYGTAGVQALGFSGATPRDPEGVAHQATVTAERLRDAQLEHSAAPIAAVTLDAAKAAAALRQGAEELRRVLASLREVRIRKDSALDYRNEALVHFDACAITTARFLRAFCELTDQPDVARQVRNALRRSRRQG